jgi:hypothetical protein
MPRYNYVTKADYDAIYYANAESDPTLPKTVGLRENVYYHYHRKPGYPAHLKWAEWLINSSGFDLSRVAIIGSGFPWTQEALHSLGRPLGTIASQDTSPYIHSAPLEDVEHRAEIQRVGLDPESGHGATLLAHMTEVRLSYAVADQPISGGGGRANVRQLCGGRPTFCFSEHVIESLYESEILELTDDMKAIGNLSTVYAHAVTTKMHNERTFDIRPLADWRAFFDANGHSDVVMIDGWTYEVG